MTPPANPETLRVPAFKRKKSLAKKAAKKPAKRLSKRLVRKTPKMKMKPMKKKIAKKTTRATRPSLAPTPRKTVPRLQPIGMVTHYYDRINVGVLKLSSTLRLGDRLRLKGKQGEFDQVVKSMQVEHKPIEVAQKGADLGFKVDQEVRTDAIAYKIL